MAWNSASDTDPVYAPRQYTAASWPESTSVSAEQSAKLLSTTSFSFGCEIPTFLRPMDVTLSTAELSRAERSAKLPTIPDAPTITSRSWPTMGTIIDGLEAIWLVTVMGECALQSNPHTAAAQRGN